jgi:hypothetical protein
MVPKVQQTEVELQEHLADQLWFLDSSVISFDNGFDGEAKRLATTIRVLLHDTRYSKSLLGQLGMKNQSYWDTATGWEENEVFDAMLVLKHYDGKTATYRPVLDRTIKPMLQCDFETWWNRSVFIDKNKNVFTRKDLVLTVADQDGGAHIDPALEEKYVALSRRNSLGWSYAGEDGQRSLGGPERAAIRQISHELLKSLKPDYVAPEHSSAGMFVGPMTTNIPGLSVAFKTSRGGNGLTLHRDNPFLTRDNPNRRSVKIGRNQLCPCGSGKKYKKCHGQ